MINVLIWLLTAVMIIDCVFLILLVLVQLPKKEAGAGMAFGGAATDALFGAGSGTALTKITKYAATIFFVATLSLATLHARAKKPSSAVQEYLKNQPSQTTTTPAVPPAGSVVTPTAPAPATAPAVVPAAPATTNK